MTNFNLEQLTPQTAPDFSDPLGLINACHQRILASCELLEKLADHLRHNEVDAEVVQASKKIHHYFSTAALHHHEDEEQDIFPLLIRTSLKMAGIINQLKNDHRQSDEQWAQLAPLLAQPRNIDDLDSFQQQVSEFCNAQRDHIKREEHDFFDIAQHMLSSEQLQKVSKSMKDRREPKF
jgi:hemerythrin-like domain-containing protein